MLGPVSLVPAACWAVLVSLCLYANQQRAAEIDDADEARMVQVKMLFLVLSLYWVWQYVASTVHVTVAGAFASWYFLKHSPTQRCGWGFLGSARSLAPYSPRQLRRAKSLVP